MLSNLKEWKPSIGLLHAALIGVFFILGGVVLTALYQSGILWNLLLPRIGNMEAYMAAADLTAAAEKQPDLVIIGDAAFLQTAEKHIPKRFSYAQCRIDHFDFSDIPSCLKILENLGLDVPVVSGLPPFFLSTVEARGPQTESWTTERMSHKLFSLNYVHRAFKMIQLWARSPMERAMGSDHRPMLNELVSFTTHEDELSYYSEARRNIIELAQRRRSIFLWVEDIEGVDYTLAPNFWAIYQSHRKTLSNYLPTGSATSWEVLEQTNFKAFQRQTSKTREPPK